MIKKFNPSLQQQAIFDFVANGRGHAVIEAKAGSGKTTTILQSMKYVPKGNSITFLTFNNEDIAKHSSILKKMEIDATAKTFHTLGLSAWQKFTADDPCIFDQYKISKILQKKLTMNDLEVFGRPVMKLVEKAKFGGLVPEEANYLVKGILSDNLKEWVKIIKLFAIELNDIELGVQIAKETLFASIQDKNTYDFNDMLYMPVVYDVNFCQKDFIFIDEAQDTSDVRREMVKRAIKEGGRLIAVGDTYQSIYGFAGANPDSMELLKRDLQAEVLPLSVTYRCAASIVAMAQTIVPEIQAHENAPMGKVENLGVNFDIQEFRDIDLILCRKYSHLILFAYYLSEKKIPCQIKGRDIGRRLISLIEKEDDSVNIDDLMKKLNERCRRECDRLLAKDDEVNLEEVVDKYGAMEALIGEMKITSAKDINKKFEKLNEKCKKESDRLLAKDDEANLEGILDKYGAMEALIKEKKNISVKEIIKNLRKMFKLGFYSGDDKKKNQAELKGKTENILTLSTIHRAKGLMRPRIYILNKSLMPSKYAKQKWEIEQEKNIEYMAYTRAVEELYFISFNEN